MSGVFKDLGVEREPVGLELRASREMTETLLVLVLQWELLTSYTTQNNASL